MPLGAVRAFSCAMHDMRGILFPSMERISSNGETYVKASSIARELGYTADYVGQLCRSGQVDAQLVGRSWFVNENSIRAHKRNRYRSTSAKSKEAVREELAARTTRTPMNVRAHFQTIPQPQSVRYEPDEESVLPIVRQREAAPVQASEPDEVSIPMRRIETERPARQEEERTIKTTDEAYEVPIRRGSALTVRARKMREEAMRQQSIPREAPAPVSSVEEQIILPTPPQTAPETGQWALIGVSFATAAALIASVSLIGFESHLITDSTGSYTTYELNFASAIESLE